MEALRRASELGGDGGVVEAEFVVVAALRVDVNVAGGKGVGVASDNVVLWGGAFAF